MTRRLRFTLFSATGLVLLLLIVAGVGVLTVRSVWFYNKIRDRIVSVTEDATGGRVEIQRFTFDWHTLTAVVDGFTLHGNEPASDPPLFHADTIVVGLKIISLLKRDVDIALLRVETPKAFLLIAPDGSTNVPNPKTPRETNKTASETILDLAIKRFEIDSGSVEIHGAGQPPRTQRYDAKGNNLRALLTFDSAVPRYHGDISMAPLELAYGGSKSIPVNISSTVAIEKNRLVVEQSHLSSGDSQFDLNGRVENFNAPVISAEYKARVSLAQAGSLLDLRSRQSGWIEATGSATYKSATDYAVQAVAKAYDVDYRGNGLTVRGVRAQAKVDAGPASITINNLVADALGGQLNAKAVIRGFDRFQIDGVIRHLDIRQAARLATTTELPYDGVASGKIFAEGRLANLKNQAITATARLNISPAGKGAPLTGFIDAKYNGSRGLLDLGQSFVALPHTRLEFQGALGAQLNIHFTSSDLDDVLPVLTAAASKGEPPPQIPVTVTPQGQLSFDGAVTGKLSNPVLAGNLSGQGFIVQGQTIDSLTAGVNASEDHLTVNNGILRQKTVTASFSGTIGLRDWKPADDRPVNASLGLRNADVNDLLALANHKNIQVSGTLNAGTKITGTYGNPQATADLTLVHGKAYGEPIDRLTAHVDAPSRTSQTLTAQLVDGPNQINLNATYDHGADAIIPGRLTFHAISNDIVITRVATLHQREPDVSGTTRIKADGEAALSRDAAGNIAFALSTIHADVSTQSFQVASKKLGDLHLTADTAPGTSAVDVKLRSNLADATITADGRWTLSGDFSGSGKLQFSNVHLDTLRRLVLTPQQAESIRFGGTAEGSVDVSGPLAHPEQLRASLDIPKLEVIPTPDPNGPAPTVDLTVHNSGPIRATMANQIVTIESAHIVARDSDFTVSGHVALNPRQEIALGLEGNLNLALLHLFNNDLISSGAVVARAGVRGTFNSPQFTGSVQLKDANLAIADVPNGLSHANGTIDFSGNQASIRDLTAESGGGKVRASGFAALAGGTVTFRLRADATGVRIRYPQGVSTVADAQLTLVGTPTRSTLAGSVTIDRLAFNPKTDLGSILSSASAPPETPSASTGFTSGLQLDVQIQTAPDITFESSYTESVEADANLRLRGTIANPALLGRVNITQGELTFFGNKYTINQGSISFFNPVKLEPVLNIDLETVARGVDVTLTVSGPITKLNVSYRSDPPLQFSDIVALLATGRTPNDATIAARQPTAPSQSWQQMGASAIVGQAIANPVAGRLQRFFGVSKLKIDPTISGSTGSPQAKVTLEQQVTPDITFTYITDVANAQEQVIRVEWAFSLHWSAVAMRDENGEFGIDFLYKKRFR